MKNLSARNKRIKRVREKIKKLGVFRVSVFKTSKHIYAQLFSTDGCDVILSASSLEKCVKNNLSFLKIKVQIAGFVGDVLADRIISKGILKLAFDKSGYKYHGRVKALAQSLKNKGISC